MNRDYYDYLRGRNEERDYRDEHDSRGGEFRGSDFREDSDRSRSGRRERGSDDFSDFQSDYHDLNDRNRGRNLSRGRDFASWGRNEHEDFDDERFSHGNFTRTRGRGNMNQFNRRDPLWERDLEIMRRHDRSGRFDRNDTLSRENMFQRSREPRETGPMDKIKSFFGKGPKGWKRSDERIREEAAEALTDSYAVDASNIDVTAKEGTIYLRGSVPDRQMKREAERCVESIRGVEDVRNELTVTANQNVRDLRNDDSGKRASNLS